MPIPHPLRAWRRLRSESADAQVEALREDLGKLGYSWIVLPFHLRSALRSYHLWEGRAFLHNALRAALAYGLFMVIVASYTNDRVPPLLGVLFFWLPLFTIIPTIGAPRRMRQYRLVATCAVAIGSCATAAAAGGSDRPRELRAASAAIRSVERDVFRVRRAQRIVARGRRSRKAALRQHAGKVVAVLRAAEARLDVGHQAAALEELTGVLVAIASSSAAGRIGGLLPENITDRYQAVRDYELLRLTVAVLMVLGSVAAVAMWEVPDAAAWPVIAGVGLLSAIVAFGADWRRFVSVIELLRG